MRTTVLLVAVAVLRLAAPVRAIDREVVFQQDLLNTQSWLVDGEADAAVALLRGEVYTFTVLTNGSHPFQIGASVGGAPYANGLTGGLPAVSASTLTWIVPADAPDALAYFCTVHSFMSGPIDIAGIFASGFEAADGFVGWSVSNP